MPLKKDKEPKRLSIGKVAEKLKISESTLRFWEKEFDIIRPKTNNKGTRFYVEEDIKAIRLVYYLVKEKKLTLAGARKKLKENREEIVCQEEIVNKLKGIRGKIQSLIDTIDSLEPEE